MADSATPLVAGCWYVICTTTELDAQKMLSRWILDQNIVVRRTENGTPVAMDNRCPHRSFPLSKGFQSGDEIVCGYHGMSFDSEGQCTRLPAGAEIRGKIALRTYPLIERAPLIWIWMGAPSKADPSLLPDYPSLTEASWIAINGYYHVAANYVGLHENLQDLSHFEYLHSSSIGVPDRTPSSFDARLEDGKVRCARLYANVQPPPLYQTLLDLGPRIDRKIRVEFTSPALTHGDMTIRNHNEKPNEEEQEYHTRILHFLTPESQNSTHYWWYFIRDFALDNGEIGDLLKRGIQAAFAEDQMALESISELTRRDPRTTFRELSFATDQPGILMRRTIAAAAGLE
ncbi:MAG: hypothetical protein BGP04_03960 [Rhizobiales bacterium 62-17]|nr:MAG: hypothetical protein BGP04_03960 [Rhizobiales bacterium 62-17]